MTRPLRPALGLALGLLASPAWAGDAALAGRVIVEPASLAPGERGTLAVELDVPEGWHLWAMDPGEGPQPLRLQLEGAAVAPSGPWFGPEPVSELDRGFNRVLARYGSGRTLSFEREVEVAAGSKPGSADLTLVVRGQICTEAQCLSQKLKLPVTFTVASAPTGAAPRAPHGVALREPAPSDAAPAAQPAPAAQLAPTAEPAPTAQLAPAAQVSPASLPVTGSEGVLEFLLLAFLAGLGALATPCVFPAIPLTVSFFSKFTGESFGRGARLAAVYALSMMAFFTGAGVLISIVVGATGVQAFASHPVFNFALGAVLVFFSLNLLGMFEIKVPDALADFTNRIEQRWGFAPGKAARGGLGDYLAVAVAAMTATTVFFTCTVAFVGVVVVAASKGDWFWPTLGMLAFSAAFVLPFFVLAMFPQAARRLRGKSGSWLVVTRTTLGFIELAAAAKFFSNADLVWETNLISRSGALALWVSLFAMAGLFLLGKLRFGEEAAPDGEAISVPRMLLGAATLAFSLHLAVGLFAGRPLGWIEGWLPPAPAASLAATEGGQGTALRWHATLDTARAEAKTSGKPVFVNYTGYTCTNCRYMEASVFTRPEIAAHLRRMVGAELYTDGQRPEHDVNREDQLARFKTAALPFYAVETADGRVLATFPSSTNDPAEFERFLAAGLAAHGSAAAPSPPAAAPSTPNAAPSGATTNAAPTGKAAPGVVALATVSLDDGRPRAALEPGRWTLVNFWATFCSPCLEELREFLARRGHALEQQGVRFVAVTIDELDDRPRALEIARDELGLPPHARLALPPDLPPGTVGPELGFDGAMVPHSALVSPDGRVVWKKSGSLSEAELNAVITEHLGLASRR